MGTDGRVLCVLGVLVAVALLVAARFFLPYVMSHAGAATFLKQPCIFKRVTGVPCPFCGGTRATVAAAQGRFVESVKLSPLGIPLVIGCVLGAPWLGVCALSGRDLGLSSVGRLLGRAPMGTTIFGGLALLWLYKIIAHCVFTWG